MNNSHEIGQHIQQMMQTNKAVVGTASNRSPFEDLVRPQERLTLSTDHMTRSHALVESLPSNHSNRTAISRPNIEWNRRQTATHSMLFDPLLQQIQRHTNVFRQNSTQNTFTRTQPIDGISPQISVGRRDQRSINWLNSTDSQPSNQSLFASIFNTEEEDNIFATKKIFGDENDGQTDSEFRNYFGDRRSDLGQSSGSTMSSPFNTSVQPYDCVNQYRDKDIRKEIIKQSFIQIPGKTNQKATKLFPLITNPNRGPICGLTSNLKQCSQTTSAMKSQSKYFGNKVNQIFSRAEGRGEDSKQMKRQMTQTQTQASAQSMQYIVNTDFEAKRQKIESKPTKRWVIGNKVANAKPFGVKPFVVSNPQNNNLQNSIKNFFERHYSENSLNKK